MKYTLKFDNINIYLCSLTLGLLQHMLKSRNYEIGVWTLGIPIFQNGLEGKGVDKKLVDIIQGFDEFDAMNKLGMDVSIDIKEKIEAIHSILNELNCHEQVNRIVLE